MAFHEPEHIFLFERQSHQNAILQTQQKDRENLSPDALKFYKYCSFGLHIWPKFSIRHKIHIEIWLILPMHQLLTPRAPELRSSFQKNFKISENLEFLIILIEIFAMFQNFL